jgi:hypothetical protein
MKETYYFAYGSNMNLDQMAYRCPAAFVVENVKLDGYRLTFCGREAVLLPFCQKREAGWKECFGNSHRSVKKDWTFMKDIHTCMERSLFLFRERMV